MSIDDEVVANPMLYLDLVIAMGKATQAQIDAFATFVGNLEAELGVSYRPTATARYGGYDLVQRAVSLVETSKVEQNTIESMARLILPMGDI